MVKIIINYLIHYNYYNYNNCYYYYIDESNYSLLDKNNKLLETPIQRLARLRSELNDLEMNLNDLQYYNNNNLSSSSSLSLSSWSILQKEILKIKDLQNNNNNNNNTINDDIYNIDKRLRLLEKILVYSSNIIDTNKKLKNIYPLLDIISIIEGKCSYYEINNIDSLKMKIFSLKKELETSISLKDTKLNKISILDQKAIEYMNKINDIKQKVDQVENIIYEFPNIILRLKSLEITHIKASYISSKLNEIENKIETVKTNLIENSDLINILKSGLNDNNIILKQNIKSIL